MIIAVLLAVVLVFARAEIRERRYASNLRAFRKRQIADEIAFRATQEVKR